MSCHEIDPIKRCSFVQAFERIVISIQQREHEIPDVLAFARGLIFSPVIFEIRERGGTDPEKIVETFAEALIKNMDQTLLAIRCKQHYLKRKNIGKIFSRTLIWLWRYVMTVWIHNVLVSTLNCAWNCTVALNIVRIVNASRISITNQAIWLTSSESNGKVNCIYQKGKLIWKINLFFGNKLCCTSSYSDQ